MYLRRKYTTKWQSNQLKLQTDSVKFAAVSLPVCKASEASKKFPKHVVLLVVL